LLRFYPAAWRRRYGDEFAAVLEERPLGPFDVADVLLGAIDAHLHGRGRWVGSDARKGFSMTQRIGGVAAILFGLLWAAGLAWASAVEYDDDTIALAMMVVAHASLIVGLIGLSAFQARSHPRLIWSSVVVPLIGSAVALAGTVALTLNRVPGAWAGVPAWDLWAVGILTMAIGSILFAVATYRTRALDRRAAAFVGIGAATCIVAGGFIGLVPFVAGLVLFSLGWIWLGIDAIRRDRPAIAPAI
jgi:hypothetical protein